MGAARTNRWVASFWSISQITAKVWPLSSINWLKQSLKRWKNAHSAVHVHSHHNRRFRNRQSAAGDYEC